MSESHSVILKHEREVAYSSVTDDSYIRLFWFSKAG